jgi:hypothetical protein
MLLINLVITPDYQGIIHSLSVSYVFLNHLHPTITAQHLSHTINYLSHTINYLPFLMNIKLNAKDTDPIIAYILTFLSTNDFFELVHNLYLQNIPKIVKYLITFQSTHGLDSARKFLSHWFSHSNECRKNIYLCVQNILKIPKGRTQSRWIIYICMIETLLFDELEDEIPLKIAQVAKSAIDSHENHSAKNPFFFFEF